jgi:hypothetical protein
MNRHLQPISISRASIVFDKLDAGQEALVKLNAGTSDACRAALNNLPKSI